MAIKEMINGFLEKRRQEKAMQKQAEAEDRIVQKIETKKKTPMERELEKYQKQEYQRKVEKEVIKIRNQKKYDSEMKNAPINQKSIFRNDGNIFGTKNIFMSKPFKVKHDNTFKGKNIFISKAVKI
jgi:hypothetical protein